ncbi:peptidase [Streptomyces sp. NBC_00435]|uniref:trypsin-like serine peptidase n=1 Tax=Streptomyces sp. NBC_00435 TaxID=2903649 RepID=UPI002E1CD56F
MKASDRAPSATTATKPVLAPGTPSAANPAPAPVKARASSSATSFEQRHTEGFWTAERMRSAALLDLVADTGARSQAATLVSRAARTVWDAVMPTVIGPTRAPASSAVPFPQTGGPWTGGGAVVRTSGRVFFTFQGRTASCSGDSVTSQNGSTVITAGHCVKYQGRWHTDWVFVPAYDNGSAPYGQWRATRTFSTDQWVANEDIDYDVGLAVVAPLNGRKLSSVVGAQGVLFNGGYDKATYAFGFPAAAPYDGTRLIHCGGDSGRDLLLSNDHSLGCDMTGGSSGGPWFQNFDEATGTGLQVSVNSFGYAFLPNRMFGPYFGPEAKAAYDKAQTS